jgi:carboxypeptidase T
MRRTVLATAIAVAGLNTAAATEWVVEAHYPDAAALARAAARFQHVIVDAKRNVLRVDTSESGIHALEDAGLTVSIDGAASSKLQAFYAKFEQAKAAGGGIDSIPGFACFRTVEETYQTMDSLASSHPGIVKIENIGPTWQKSQDSSQGYEMRALQITNLATAATSPSRPRMVVFSSIHAREYAPAELDTRFAEWLVNGYGTDPEATWLVDNNDFRLVLQANPDGRKLAEQQVYQRKNMDVENGPCSNENEFSQPGVDLNRNFPFHWNITNGAGSSDVTCSQTYRGPSVTGRPLEQGTPEPETQNLVRYVAGTCSSDGSCTGGLFADRRTGPMDPPSIGGDGGAAAPPDTSGFFVDIHSNAALVLWPWGDTPSAAPNQVALRTLGRRIAYFNDYTPEQSDQLYATDGTTDDTMYGLLGVPGFTIETDGFDFFQDCSSFDASTAPQNIEALRYVARTLHAPYLLPTGPDITAIAASAPAQGVGGSYVTVTATIDDTRYNQSNGNQTTYTIKSANAYVDSLPWDARATSIALTATDGAFDAKHENVTGAVPLAGLAPGRHVLYVQGLNTQSAAGTAGPPNAVFFDVPASQNDTIFVDGFEGTP